MPKLTKIFPNLSKARALLNQHAYEQAIEVYSEILLKDSADEGVEKNVESGKEGETGKEGVQGNVESGKEEMHKKEENNKESINEEQGNYNNNDNNNNNDNSPTRDTNTNNNPTKDTITTFNNSPTKDTITTSNNSPNTNPIPNPNANKAMHKRIDENDQQAHTIGYKAYIYIEYAHCLIRNVNNYFQTLLLQLNAHQPSMLQKKEIYEEDLEIAWNVLEQARLFFKMKNDTHQLKKVYFLQGEIYLLNDQYTDAIREFSECLLVEDEQFVCDGTVYKRIGDCYFFLGDRMMATTFYEKGVVYYNGVGNARKSREMELLLMSARDREEMGFREDEHKNGENEHKIREGENERMVVDVNHLIRKKSVEKGK